MTLCWIYLVVSQGKIFVQLIVTGASPIITITIIIASDFKS